MKMKKTIICTLLIIFVITIGFITFKKAKITYYASRYNGRKTATGDVYSDKLLTCATTDRTYLKKRLKFYNKDTFIVVRCNDMMAPDSILRFDLTARAFKILNGNSLTRGTFDAHFQVMD